MDQIPKGLDPLMSPAMTVRDVAAYLNVHEKTVYRLAQRGELPGFKVAGAWRFRLGDLEKWVAAQIATESSQPDGRSMSQVRPREGERRDSDRGGRV